MKGNLKSRKKRRANQFEALTNKSRGRGKLERREKWRMWRKMNENQKRR